MPTLDQALSNFSKILEVSRQQSGENGLTSNSDGTADASVSSGTTSGITGQAETPLEAASSPTGPQLGALTVAASPRTADEAQARVLELVGISLPPSMQRWLAAQEEMQRTGLQPFPVVQKPERTPEMVAAVSLSVKSLSELLAPAATRRPELVVEIGKLFAGFNIFTGDAGKMAAQVEVWVEELEEFPLYAIRKASKWAKRGEGKLPPLSAFISDVRLAVGGNVLQRRQAMEGWLKRV